MTENPTTTSTTANPSLAELPLRPELVGEEPYGAPQLDVPVCLNVNENPYPASEGLRRAIADAAAEAAAGLNRYPDREASVLRGKLADYLNARAAKGGASTGTLTADNVWAANGSNEVMTHLMGAFGGPGRTALTFAPTYSMYPEYARNTHTDYRVLPRRDDFTIDVAAAVDAVAGNDGHPAPDVVLVTTPNNPTGTPTPLDDITAICEAATGIVVVDEAYQEFATDDWPSAISLLHRFPRLVVLRTMSKAFGFAGGRLGYLVAAKAVVDACRIVRLPYHLSAVTQAVASVALDHSAELLGQVDQLRARREELVPWLTARGIEVAPSQSNFVLFGRFADRHAVFTRLLDDGVLIRETGPEGWLRVSMGTPAEMAAFTESLDRLLGQPAGRLADTTSTGTSTTPNGDR